MYLICLTALSSGCGTSSSDLISEFHVQSSPQLERLDLSFKIHPLLRPPIWGTFTFNPGTSLSIEPYEAFHKTQVILRINIRSLEIGWEPVDTIPNGFKFPLNLDHMLAVTCHQDHQFQICIYVDPLNKNTLSITAAQAHPLNYRPGFQGLQTLWHDRLQRPRVELYSFDGGEPLGPQYWAPGILLILHLDR